MDKKISLVFMVAGLSSRFGGRIKQFAKVGPNDSTLMEYSMDQALKSKFSEIIFIVGKMTEKAFKEKFGDNYKGIPVKYAKQSFNENERDRPWGTLDAVCSAKDLINNPFVVCNGDDIYGENSFKILYEHLQNSDEMATLGYTLGNVIPEKGTTNRGIFGITEDNYVDSITEMIGISKDTLSDFGLKTDDLCSMNIFGLNKEILSQLDDILINFKLENKGNRKIECYLPVELSNIIKTENAKMKIYSTPDKRLGVTNPDDEEMVKKQIEIIENNK
ncbi:MAG: sugar phosphate nucleotidyltransferase [Candidatus Absconditabacterales bacterium]|nr:sugar phosphate nucleotidyltransferase [Candidatus Absconditabacterales bacterium]